MRTNDLQTFMTEEDAQRASKRFARSYVSSFAAGNGATVWVVCKESSYSNRVLFLRDNGSFE